MKSPYYHSMELNFNVWYVLVFLFVLVMVIVGGRDYKLNRDNSRVLSRKAKERRRKIVATVLTTVLGLFIISESSSGLVQVMDNTIYGQESPLYAYVLMAFGLAVAMTLYYNILVFTAKLIAEAKREKLTRRIKK